MVLLCGDGLFGPRAAERTCSEGPSPISPWLCGGGAGGSFGNSGAAHSLSLILPPTSVVRPPSLLFSISPSSSNVSSLNIDRRIRTVRTHPPTDSVTRRARLHSCYTSPYRLSTPKNNRNKHYNSAARLFGDLIGVVITPYRNS